MRFDNDITRPVLPAAAALSSLEAVTTALTAEAGPAPEAALREVLGAVVDTVPGVRHASITRGANGPVPYVTPCATDDVALAVDALQYAAGHGPCLDALAGTPVCADLSAAGERWGAFAARALAGTPVRAVVSVPVPHAAVPASLNLYADDLALLGEDLQAPVGYAAALCGLACAVGAARDQVENLQTALTTSRRIGAAVGIVMANTRCTYEQAHATIVVTSQRTHRKVRELAEEIVLTGTLPD